MIIPTIADVVGDGAAHPVADSGYAAWIQFAADAGNAFSVRVGDSTVSATRGVQLGRGGGSMMWPPIKAHASESVLDKYYDLSKVFYFVQAGDKLQILYVAGR